MLCLQPQRVHQAALAPYHSTSSGLLNWSREVTEMRGFYVQNKRMKTNEHVMSVKCLELLYLHFSRVCQWMECMVNVVCLSSLSDHSKCSQFITTFTHTLIHLWQRLSCKVPPVQQEQNPFTHTSWVSASCGMSQILTFWSVDDQATSWAPAAPSSEII